MSTAVKARISGIFYLLTFVTGAIAFMSVNGRVPANLVATVCYVGVTILFYGLFKPVNQSVSLVAALFSLAGCVVGALSAFHLDVHINALAFFGVYCLLIGYLIF